MSVPATSLPEFFENKYRGDPDPWSFASSDYELNRYERTIAALAGHRYRYAFEPGCSVGVLTERLAAVCDCLEAIEFSGTAVALAQERCAALPNVTVRCASLLTQSPLEKCDLIVLSEIGYYFHPQQWQEIVARLVACIVSGGTLLAVHWLGVSPDHVMSGDRVHAILQAEPLLALDHSERHDSFRLDRWMRR